MTNKERESSMKFLYISLMGAVISTAITGIISSFQTVAGFRHGVASSYMLSLLAVAIAAGVVVYSKPKRTAVYGLTIGYFHGLITGILINPEIYFTGLRANTVLTLLIAPIPLMFFGIIGALIGKSLQRQ